MALSSTVDIRLASPEDAPVITRMVLALTAEIASQLPVESGTPHFDIDAPRTEALCRQWLAEGHYLVLLASVKGTAVAVAALAHSHALYAGGSIGIVQELYVEPAYRNAHVGAALLARVFALAAERRWAAIELCTPPLPAFERTLAFYRQHGFKPVGGRKMRRSC